MISSCNDSGGENSDGTTVTPVTYEINILYPANDGAPLGSSAIISGDCGQPNFPIVITGDVNLYSVCQANGTWTAAISGDGFTEGQTITVNVQLKSKDYSTGGSIVTRTFSRSDVTCENASNLTKVFANIDNGGNGTDNPYKICTAQQFANISLYPDKNFVLSQNINFSSSSINPILPPFTGILDGQNFFLENFYIVQPGQNSIGIFKFISGATVKNLNIRNANVEGNVRVGILAGDWREGGTIQNVSIQGSVTANQMAGGLIGLNNGVSTLDISDSKIDVTVNATSDYAAGLLGYVYKTGGGLTLNNVDVYANVTGLNYTAGVLGRVYGVSPNFTDVLHKGDLYSNGANIGGLVGESYHGIAIDQGVHIGSINGTLDAVDVNVGGLIGFGRATSTITNSHVVSNISSGGHYTAGLIGRMHSGSIGTSYSRGTINVNDDTTSTVLKFTGGLVGNTGLDVTFSDSYSQMDITANAQYVGGLVGFLGGTNTSIDNSYSTGTIIAKKSFVGGLVGQFNASSITNSFSESDITISDPDANSYIGGIAGYTNVLAANFDMLYTRGNITISNNDADYVGGAFGYVKAANVSNIYSSSDVTGARNLVGGIAGYQVAPIDGAMFSGTINSLGRYVGGISGLSLKKNISNSFFTGTVYSLGEGGGIVGWFIPDSTTVSKCYSTGYVYKKISAIGSDSSFGLIGGNITAPDISDCFYNSNSAVIDEESSFPLVGANIFGNSLTSSQLVVSSNYSNFDFGSLWSIPSAGFKLPGDTVDYSYAVFQWMETSNYGFTNIENHIDNPIAEPNPDIFEGSSGFNTLAQEFGQSLVDKIISSDPVSTVTVSNLEISILNPSVNGEIIVGRKLIYGECGIAGNIVEVSGDFSLNTICQTNNRWSAVIDATAMSDGPLTLNVELKNQNQTSGSGIVSKTLNKPTTECDTSVAINGLFGNIQSGGDGISTPYLICHRGQFSNIRLYPDKKFILGNDIDFIGMSLNPYSTTFSGELDGNNFAVRNYIVSKPNTVSVGLFKVFENATLKNISFEDFSVSGYSTTGGVVGEWKGNGSIDGVSLVNGAVNGIIYTGGLIGQASNSSDITINNSDFEVNVVGNNYTGGVIGQIVSSDGGHDATNLILNNEVEGQNYVGAYCGQSAEGNFNFSQVSQTGDVLAHGEKVGGLIGEMNGGTISNSAVNGSVTVDVDATDGYIGGLVGQSLAETSISSSSYTGNIHAGSDRVGGIIGYLLTGTLSYLTTSGAIDVLDEKYDSVRSYVGGIIAQSEDDYPVTLDNSSSSMNINAKAKLVGGLIGRVPGNDSTILFSHATGTVSGYTQFIGGLAGFFMGDIMEDSYATGDINVQEPTPSAYIGGLLGYSNSWNANFKRLYATGNVSVNSGTADYVGGLIGYFRGGSIENSYANGDVGGDAIRNSSGGLVGMMRGSVNRSYATGNVACTGSNCGGLLGYLLNSTVTNSFATGDVESFAKAGGLIGFVNTASVNSVQNNYAAGVVTREVSSSENISLFGPLISDELNGGSFDTTSNFYFNENKDASHNSLGQGVNLADAPNTAFYPTFSFGSMTDDWMAAPTGYEIMSGVSYALPVLDWMAGGGGGSSLFTIGGTVANLNFDSLQLSLNGAETITVNSGETSFVFSTQIASGQGYNVTISTQPAAPSITCVLTNGSGSVSTSNITNVTVTCPTVASIDLVAGQSTLDLGASQFLTVNATFSDASVVDVTNYVTWSQTPSGHFSLTQAGQLTATNAGTASIGANYFGQSDSESITAQSVPYQLAFTVNPSHSTAGVNIAPSIEVEVRDYNGSLVNTATNLITLSLQSDPSSGAATLSGTLSKVAVNGVAVFNNISIDKAFSGYTIVANSTGLNGATSSSFNISAGIKAALSFAAQPSGALANVAFDSFTVEIIDSYGNKTNDNDLITIALQNDPSSGSATLSGTLNVSALNGVATFSDISLNFATSGYTFSASATGLTGDISNSFNIFANASKLIFLSQPTSALEGANIGTFQVAVSDDFNNVITNSTANIVLNIQNDPSSGSASLSGSYSASAVNGIVTFNDLSINLAGSGYTLRATSSGLTNVTSNGFNITLPAPTTLVLLDPVSSPNEDTTPTITVYGVAAGDVVALYKNSSCTAPSVVGSFTSTGSSVDITTSVLPEGTYTFYADRLATGGQRSLCSTANLTYQVQGAFNQIDDLNSSFGNWSNVGGDDDDWSLNTGDTPSTDVGPTSGSYAYTEASSPVAANDEFHLESNILDGSTNDLAFSFKWNKRGDNMGDLILEASNNGGSTWTEVWSHLGSDIATGGTDAWRSQYVDLCNLGYTSSNVVLRFRAVMPSTGTIWNSDIAIDDLVVNSGGCEANPPATITFDSPSTDTLITLFNESSFTIGGTCSDNGQNIIISGDGSGSTSCSAGTWSTSLDLSSAGDGLVNLIVTHSSASGGANGIATKEFSKDTSYLQFDSFDTLGNWANANYDDRDWSLNSGDTPSSGVGPTSSQDSGGNYLYTEASNPVGANDEFIIESSDLDAGAFNLRIQFYWNKRGTSMGDLYLEASTDGGSSWDPAVWSHTGSDIATNGTDRWNLANVDVCDQGYNSGNVKFRFRATMPSSGTIWNSDIAIDEVKVTADGCNPGVPATIAITTPDVSEIITLANYNAFSVSGTCSDNAQNITFSGGVSGTTLCNSGAWNYTFDLSAVPDGNVQIIADHVSGSGGPTGRAIKTFVKDTSLIQEDDFESFANWNNVSGDDRDWSLNSGDTPSSGVGPTLAQGGSGSYVYTEASSPAKSGDEFILESNTLDAGSFNLSMTFYWNKRGDNMGDLYLEVSTDGGSTWDTPAWSHLGADVGRNGVDVWNAQTIDLCNLGYNSGNIKLRFRAVMPSSGTVWHSDMGLDSIKVENNGCQ